MIHTYGSVIKSCLKVLYVLNLLPPHLSPATAVDESNFSFHSWCNKGTQLESMLDRIDLVLNLSAWPEVRGTADTDGGAYSPFRSILLVLTHDFIIIQGYGPTGGDG